MLSCGEDVKKEVNYASFERKLIMRVFLLDLMMLSAISKKEEITDQTYLVTDTEANAIETALLKGCKIKSENGKLVISPARPSNFHDFNEESWEWELNQERYDAHTKETRNLLWEEIKKKREEILGSGVYVESLDKWFHTDSVTQLSYTRAKEYFDIKPNSEVQWKTMDGTFVTLNKEKLNDVVVAIFEKSQEVYKAAEFHKHKIQTSVDLENYDVDAGWVETYKG